MGSNADYFKGDEINIEQILRFNVIRMKNGGTHIYKNFLPYVYPMEMVL